MHGNLPNFIIVGAQKSGTTSLHYYLSQHPNLTASSPKEIHYFDRYVNFGYTLEWYKSHFFNKKGLSPQLYFEATPNYIYHGKIGKQLAELRPDIKLILLLREPVDRAYSAWNMYRDLFEKNQLNLIKKEIYPGRENSVYKYLYKNRESFPSFLEAVEIEQELIESNRDIEPSIIRRGFYAKQIQNYLKYLDRDQLLILGFKELVKHPVLAVNKVLSYLEVNSINVSQLNAKPKHRRSYIHKISKEERVYVEGFYREPNEALFDLLGYKPQW